MVEKASTPVNASYCKCKKCLMFVLSNTQDVETIM